MALLRYLGATDHLYHFRLVPMGQLEHIPGAPQFQERLWW